MVDVLSDKQELFYMVRGDMCVKVVEQGRFKDIHIKEGEIWVLPGRIPHSPQVLSPRAVTCSVDCLQRILAL